MSTEAGEYSVWLQSLKGHWHCTVSEHIVCLGDGARVLEKNVVAGWTVPRHLLAPAGL